MQSFKSMTREEEKAKRANAREFLNVYFAHNQYQARLLYNFALARDMKEQAIRINRAIVRSIVAAD